MKERPILMSAPMVRTILEGRKSQTRRVVKGIALDWLRPDGFTPEFVADKENGLCPYGVPGDRLWVRETWFHDFEHNRTFYRADADHDGTVPYLVSGAGGFGGGVGNAHIDRWRPSIHMPRWASRLTLEIKSVRVERVQEISEEDALAEGVETWRAGWDDKTAAEMFLNGTRARSACGDDSGAAKRLYMLLWESIHGLGSWDANPWAWCIAFERVDP